MEKIVFIHGNSSSARIIEPVKKIWKNPVQIESIELPGHGNSERFDDYSWGIMRSYLKDKVNGIEGDKLLIGHSLGGLYSMEIAPEITDLTGLVIIGAPPLKIPLNLDETFAPNPNFPVYFKAEPEHDELDKAINELLFNKTGYSLIWEDFYRADPKHRVTVGANLLNQNGPLNEAVIFSKLECPKYLINGKQDPIINFEYLRTLQAQSKFPFELIEIDQCGHCPTIERPKEFVEILEKICDAIDIEE